MTDGGIWDRIGILASAACAVHCGVAPLLFLLIPAFAEVWAHPASHALIALVVLPVAATVLLHGYRTHRRSWILWATLVGGASILVGCVLPYLGTGAGAETGGCTDCCPTLETGADGETSLRLPPASIASILGSVLLIAAHAGNLICCRHCLGRGAAAHG